MEIPHSHGVASQAPAQNPLRKGFSHRFLSGKELKALFRRGRAAADGVYLFTSLFCGKARNKLQFGFGGPAACSRDGLSTARSASVLIWTSFGPVVGKNPGQDGAGGIQQPVISG